MITRSKSNKEIFDIKLLPKEALFELLLQVEPNEIKIVCQSKNSKVREICSSKLFQEAYKNKYPKNLLQGKIETEKIGNEITLTDEKGNSIEFGLNRDHNKIISMLYTPFKQIYPSTFVKAAFGNLDENSLRKYNPIFIYIKFEKKSEMEIGRENLYGIHSVKDEEDFLNNYNQEIKEFLENIKRENWWNETLGFRTGKIDKKTMIEFNDQTMKYLK